MCGLTVWWGVCSSLYVGGLVVRIRVDEPDEATENPKRIYLYLK